MSKTANGRLQSQEEGRADANPKWDTAITRRAALQYGGAIAGLFTLPGLLAACGDVSEEEEGGASSDSEGEIVIGNISSLSGGLSPFGQSISNGLTLGVAAVNASGGVGGRKIKVITADTKSDPAHSLQQARRLVTQDKVDLLFGVEGSNLRDAVLPFSSESGVPLFYPANYEGGVYDENMVVTGMVPSQEFNIAFLEMLREEAGGSRVYHIGSDYAWPRVTSTYFQEEAFPEAGLELVGEDFVPMTQTNLAPNLSKLLRSKPDIVINNVVGEPAISFQRAIASQGLDDILWAGSAYQQVTVAAMGADADGALRSFNWNVDVDTPETKELMSEYEAQFADGAVPIYITESAYNVPLILQAAAEKAGSNDVSELMEAIPGTVVEQAPSGRIEVRDDLHCVLQAFVARCQGGEMKTVDGPVEVAPAKDQRDDNAY